MTLTWERLYCERREKGIDPPSLCWSTLKRCGVQSTLLVEETPGHNHTCLAVSVLANVTKCLTQNAFKSCSFLPHYLSTHVETSSVWTVLARGRVRLPVRKDPSVVNSTWCFWPLWALLDTSLCSTEIKKIPCPLEYTNTVINILYHHENTFTFESAIHGCRATKRGLYWNISSKRKIRRHVSLPLNGEMTCWQRTWRRQRFSALRSAAQSPGGGQSLVVHLIPSGAFQAQPFWDSAFNQPQKSEGK